MAINLLEAKNVTLKPGDPVRIPGLGSGYVLAADQGNHESVRVHLYGDSFANVPEATGVEFPVTIRSES